LSEAKADATPIARIDVRYKETLPTGTYFADWAMPQARLDAEMAIRIRSSAPRSIRACRISPATSIARAPLGKAQVALVAMRPMAKSWRWLAAKATRTALSTGRRRRKRQPGSTFKLFVYTAALRSGMTPESKVDDSPITEGLPIAPKITATAIAVKSPSSRLLPNRAMSSLCAFIGQLGYSAVARRPDLGIESPLNKRRQPCARQFGDDLARTDRRLMRVCRQ
jgi:penicillin-binding protein 1A